MKFGLEFMTIVSAVCPTIADGAQFTPAAGRRCLIGADGSNRKHWPSDVDYTTKRRLHDHEPDELKASLKSEPSKSGNL